MAVSIRFRLCDILQPVYRNLKPSPAKVRDPQGVVISSAARDIERRSSVRKALEIRDRACQGEGLGAWQGGLSPRDQFAVP